MSTHQLFLTFYTFLAIKMEEICHHSMNILKTGIRKEVKRLTLKSMFNRVLRWRHSQVMLRLCTRVSTQWTENCRKSMLSSKIIMKMQAKQLKTLIIGNVELKTW